MPFWLTIATTVFLVGLLGAVRDSYGLSVAAVGLLGILASVAFWIREDVHELRGKPFSVGHSEYLAGTIVLVLSEVIIFGVLFFFFFWSKSHTHDFVPEIVSEMSLTPIWINTALLISSGVTVEIAKVGLKKGNMGFFRFWLGVTILLGAAFLVGQVLEYKELIHEGLTPQAYVFGTAFYGLTGVHGLHVLGGVVVLSTIWALSTTGFIGKERMSGVEGAFIYWHFVDVIWILVVTFVYLRVV